MKLGIVKTSNRQNLKTSKDHADHSDHGDQSSIINLWTENPCNPRNLRAIQISAIICAFYPRQSARNQSPPPLPLISALISL